jgi:hypothetical protein
MSEKKGWGTTVLGWFVTREGEEPGKGGGAGSEDADALIAKYAGQAAPPPSPVKLAADVPRPPDSGAAAIDFAGVFRAAGVDDEEQGRIEKATSLLKTLPAETPKDVKRQIVEASLKAFGYPVDQIIEAGAGEIQALQAYIEMGQADTQKLLAEGNERIASLEKEMQQVKALMERKVSAQQELTNQCNAQKLRVQEVLEFFGQEAVAKVVRESPKLHEPQAGAK